MSTGSAGRRRRTLNWSGRIVVPNMGTVKLGTGGAMDHRGSGHAGDGALPTHQPPARVVGPFPYENSEAGPALRVRGSQVPAGGGTVAEHVFGARIEERC